MATQTRLDRRHSCLGPCLGAIVVILASTLSVPVAAQPHSWFTASGQCNNGTNTIGFSGLDLGGHPEIVGFDVYRSNSSLCGPSTRITEDPLPRTVDESFSHEIIDTDITEGELYRYHIVGVDAERTTTMSLYTLFPLPGSSDEVYAGCNAPRSHGTVVDWGWTVAIEPCPDSCLPFSHLETGMEELQPYLGETVLVYGPMGFTIEGWGLALEDWAILPCTVAVEDTPWSHVKSLFR